MIQRDEDWASDHVVYTLRVPGFWLVTARWPRLALAWWLLKLAFQDWRKPLNQNSSEA